MDTELSYAYDELYTKAIVNHSRGGYVLRALCSICIWLAFLLYVLAPKYSLDKVDMAITYVLLSASIFLDATAIIMLLFSDWMVFSLLNVEKLGQGHWTERLAMHIVKIKSELLKKRSWSREMPQLNLISNCLKNSTTKEAPWRRMMNWIGEMLGLVQETKLFPGSFGDRKIYTLRALQPIMATHELQEIIVKYAQKHLKKIRRENAALSSVFKHVRALDGFNFSIKSEKEFINNSYSIPLDIKVVIWHIATELCFYWKSKYLHSLHAPQIVIETEDNESSVVMGKTSEKDACKYLSNYMMHMVVMRPEMTSTTDGNSPTLFWNVYNSIFRFIHESCIDDKKPNVKVEDVCKKMMTIDSYITQSDHMLDTAQLLAKMMILMEEEQRWHDLTKLWVELLIERGKVPRANMHLKQLSKGGEPLTLTWLLTRHMKLVL